MNSFQHFQPTPPEQASPKPKGLLKKVGGVLLTVVLIFAIAGKVTGRGGRVYADIQKDMAESKQRSQARSAAAGASYQEYAAMNEAFKAEFGTQTGVYFDRPSPVLLGIESESIIKHLNLTVIEYDAGEFREPTQAERALFRPLAIVVEGTAGSFEEATRYFAWVVEQSEGVPITWDVQIAGDQATPPGAHPDSYSNYVVLPSSGTSP